MVVGAGPCQLARLAVRPEAHLKQLCNTTESPYVAVKLIIFEVLELGTVQPASVSTDACFCWELLQLIRLILPGKLIA